jgi:cytoskeletal protein CcmA (bactofilin family)
MSSEQNSEKQRLTVVENGTEFKGTLSSSCPVAVHGRIEGEIKTPALSVTATGAVHGRAKVGSVRSEGELSGEFDADSVELAGRVLDNTVIRARSLHVRLGSERGKLQVIFGECELAVGDEPVERVVTPQEAAVSPAPLAAVPAPVEAPPAEAPPVEPPAIEAPAAAMVTAFDIPPAPALPNLDAPPAVESSAKDAEGTTHKSSRKSKKGASEAANGWSQPPSQPPPAS